MTDLTLAGVAAFVVEVEVTLSSNWTAPTADVVPAASLLPAIAAEAFISASTITPLAIAKAPAFDKVMSPEGVTEVATLEPFPTRMLPSVNAANLL